MKNIRRLKFLITALIAVVLVTILELDVNAATLNVSLGELGAPVFVINRPSSSAGYYEKRWVQGATITSSHYVYAMISNGNVNPEICYTPRSYSVADGHQSCIRVTSWSPNNLGALHLNDLHYDWQNRQVWVQTGAGASNGCEQWGKCLNAASFSEETCKSCGSRGYSGNPVSGYVGQANETMNNWGYAVYSQDTSAYIRLCPSTTSCGTTTHSIIVNGFGAGEIEDIAFDSNGDMYLIFNRWDTSNYTAFYKLPRSRIAQALGVETSPGANGAGSTITTSGATGGSAVSPSSEEHDDNKEDASGDGVSPSAPVSEPVVIEEKCETILLPDEWCGEDGAKSIARFVLSLLMGISIVAGTIGIVLCGIMWMTAQGNEAQVVKAKKRIVEIVIGIILFSALYAIYCLLVPSTENPYAGVITIFRG